MCRSESIWQSNSGCQNSNRGETSHIYSHVTYFLCDDSRDGRPCQNVKASTEEYSDAALPGSCPVCEAIDSATSKYNITISQNRDEPEGNYKTTELQASRQRDKEISDAWSVVQIIRPKKLAKTEIDTPQQKRLTSTVDSVEHVLPSTFSGPSNSFNGGNSVLREPATSIHSNPVISSRPPLSSDRIDQSTSDQTSQDRDYSSLKNTYVTQKSVIEDPSALHPVYQIVAKPRKFFKPGRVFSVVWTEPAGPSTSLRGSRNVTTVSFDQQAYTEIRRFVVARAMKDHCLALPIHTFGGRGSQEATARPDDHRPVFAISENWDKSTLSEEEIPIKIEDPDVEIKHGISFIVFSKHYTIEHYLPARNLGYVVKDALPILEACFRAAMGISIKAGGVGAPSALYAASGIELATDYLHTEPMQGIIEQMTFKCDYDSCHQTQSKTFSQKEAYRDHLRDFHREDILGSRRVDDLWFETRDIQERWWRCKNCLSRVPISQDGYTCSTCYEPCEVERINARKARFEAEMPRIIVTESGTNLEWNKKFGVSRGVSDEDGSVSVLGKSPYTPPPTSWQKSSGSKSRRKLSSSKSYNGSKSRGLQPEAFEKVVESGFDLPAGTSFLFQVNQLEVNDDTTAGGVAPRVNENGNWIPPVFSNGFGAQTAGYLYRWNANGSVSRANDCQWYNGTFWMTATENSPSQQLTTYCTRTVFWCDPWAQFMFATGDASTRDMENSTHPHNHWRHLTFENDGPVSRIVESGENQYLAGSGSAWIADLGLTSHVHRHAPAAGGLSGSLAITLGIIAMSCPASSFDTMLVMDRAWRHHRWRGHRRGDGRSDHRGVVVHIYLDPANPTGSTFNTLHDLEAEGTPLIN